jgi:ABC-type lipoprotein export system ATPase subunit
MQNIEMKVEGNKLVLTIDLTKEIGPSSSGKTTLLASSEGNANVPGHEGVKFGLNVYRAKK